MSNDERNPKSEVRKELRACSAFRASSFVILSSFVIRHSADRHSSFYAGVGCSTIGVPLRAASFKAMAEGENFLGAGGLGAARAVSLEPGSAVAAAEASVTASGLFGSEGEAA